MKNPVISEILVCIAALAFLLASGCEEKTGGDATGQRGDAAQGGQPPFSVPAVAEDPESPNGEQAVDAANPDAIYENPFVEAGTEAISTFSIDVDTASYSFTRQALSEGRLPAKTAVRAEEFINYFTYNYTAPAITDEHPFLAHVEVSAAPWQPADRLVRIGLKGAEVQVEHRPAANLVFLIDVSGSMTEDNKLPLLKSSLAKLVRQLNADDRLAIVTYAGNSGVALESTPGDQHDKILAAIAALEPGGGTNGQAGIAAAYDQASLGVQPAGINRVVLCTDGDFNLGQTSPEALVQLIRSKAEGGIFLTALGFGSYVNDTMLETLADDGDGNYAVIDIPSEADKVLVRAVTGTLVTIAKDVKVQVEFNSAVVKRYRLIGYENRRMSNDDFRNDAKDAGEIGAGHTVTALYEVELVEGADASAEDLATLRTRYKKPGSETGIEMETKVHDQGTALADSTPDFRFAAAAAAFAMKLRGSAFLGAWNFAQIKAAAQAALGADLDGYRAEMVTLIDQAQSLTGP